LKNILVMGCGAQGSTIAKRLDEEPSVEQIVCADYDRKAVEELERTLNKAKAVTVDATDVDAIAKAGDGCQLIVNGLAPDFNMKVMDVALRLGAHYQDMASGPVSDIGFVDAVKRQFGRDQEFKDAGLACLTNTGSAPGIANVMTRDAVDLLESCSRIDIFVYDGIWSHKFIPFWWSPETAFGDMAAEPVVFKNGEFIRVTPFNNPEMTEFRSLGIRRMVDHEHEEPVTMGLLADKVLKGVTEVNFRYGGPGCELAEAFYKMGLLSDEPIDVNGTKIVPMDLISVLTPPAPKYPEEIAAVLEEGMVSEEGAFLVRVEGTMEGRQVRIDSYAGTPGLTESFEKAGITHESYFTGQAAFLFTKMFVHGKITQRGVFPPEVLEADERAYYLAEAEKLDITVDRYVETRLY